MIQKIAIAGNACAGKTTLGRSLAKVHALQITHVDSIQYLAGMKVRPHRESIQLLTEIQTRNQWIIEGYGPLDMIEKRFQAADKVVFIDFPIWRLYWWATIRQIKNAWSTRPELPEGCTEFNFAQTHKLFRTISKVHHQMRPELLKIFARENLKHKMIWIKTVSELKRLGKHGIQ